MSVRMTRPEGRMMMFAGRVPGEMVTECVRLLKMGDTMNVLMHLKPGPDFTLKSFDQLDDIRTRFNDALKDMEVRAIADVVFINDMKMAE